MYKPKQRGSEGGNWMGWHFGSPRRSSRFTDGLPLLSYGPCPFHGFVEFVCFRSVCDEAGATFFHDFGSSALIGNNSKAATHHRFDQRQRQPFGARGQDQRVMSFPDRFNVAYKTWEIDVFEGQACSKAAQGFAVAACAEKRNGQIAISPLRPRQHMQENVLPLLACFQARDASQLDRKVPVARPGQRASRHQKGIAHYFSIHERLTDLTFREMAIVLGDKITAQGGLKGGAHHGAVFVQRPKIISRFL